LRKAAVCCGCFAGLLLAAGCNSNNNKVAPVDTKAAEQAVKDADTKWSKAAQAHDLSGVDSYYADDAAVLPANAELITNKAGATKFWMDHLTDNVDVSWTPMYVESAKDGDLVYDLGSYTMTTKPAKGKGVAVTDHGKYLAVWKKQADGSWKAEADEWNSDKAAPAVRTGG
jgi:ketosteroid isomerase-like protein